MKNPKNVHFRAGFTLMETVIAIGVLALLLTGFLAVFAPATAGIRKAVSIQEADRLAFALQNELTALKSDSGDYETGFEKAYEWIEGSATDNTALLVYQYRADVKAGLRADGTQPPYTSVGGTAGEDFVIQPMVRQKSDIELEQDLKALEGRIYAVKLTQLVYENGELSPGEEGKIEPPDGEGSSTGPDDYPEAVIAFAAEFHLLPNSSIGYIRGSKFRLRDLTQPIFTRNLAVRR